MSELPLSSTRSSRREREPCGLGQRAEQCWSLLSWCPATLTSWTEYFPAVATNTTNMMTIFTVFPPETLLITLHILSFLDPEDGSQKATAVVLLVVVISSIKIPKAFLIHSGAQWNFAYTFVLTFPTDLYRLRFSADVTPSFLWSKFVSRYRFRTWHWTFTNIAAACCSTVRGGA